MKIKICIILFVLLTPGMLSAQKYLTKTGHIKFYSEAPLEKIEAHNRQVNCALDLGNGDFAFRVLMKSFEFEKALMQEHFNENYVESDKFPNATFLGKVDNLKDITAGKEGIYQVNVEGKLTIHGVTNIIKEKGTLELKQGKVIGKARFSIIVADYKISIPGAVVKNVSKTVDITVDISLEKASK